jgi:hypothetical protein
MQSPRIFSWIASWRTDRHVNRESVRISQEVYPTLWEDVCRKLPSTSQAELTEYANIRAAQLVQPHVDALLKQYTALGGVFGSRLVVKSSERAARNSVAAALQTKPSTKR